MKQIGLYVHIPFCKSKCSYCDFVSYSSKEELIEEYIKWLCYEIREVGEGIKLDIQNKLTDNVVVKTIYIGGGTPSFIDSKYITKILETIYKNYNVEPNAEITLEINPGTVDKEKLIEYKNSGINRLSIGTQTSNNNLLKMLGRIHTYEEFEETYNKARKVGFNNINIDFMIGLPNQTLEDIENMIKEIKKLQPNHVSVYSLIVEDNTPIKEKIEKGILKLPNDELERKMYWTIKNKLESLGYKHYEISNFSIPNYESKHNLDCWKQGEYMGFGVSAHSYIDGARFSNIDSIEEYIENYKNNKQENNFILHEKQNMKSKMQEYVLLGLRKIDGISCSTFEEKFGKDIFDVFEKELTTLMQKDLITAENGYIKLTNKGIDLANIVWEEFV